MGHWWADRWPDPRTVVVDAGGNYLVRGEPSAVRAADLRPRIQGFVDAPREFEPLLRTLSDRFTVWERIVYVLDGPPNQTPREPVTPDGVTVRALTESDGPLLAALEPDLTWIG